LTILAFKNKGDFGRLFLGVCMEIKYLKAMHDAAVGEVKDVKTECALILIKLGVAVCADAGADAGARKSKGAGAKKSK
jgi:hypothetical protein